MPTQGTLFIVATPIGNLEDITLRALRVLKEVDLVAAEDTRRTLKLLSHFGIRRPLVSLREHNEVRGSERLVRQMLEGLSIAYVSDAGTPGIADPGARLVAAARRAGVAVSPIPGPSAVSAAMSVSGHIGPEFVFMGFPPASGQARSLWFDRLTSEDRAAVFFEAPHRFDRTMAEMGQIVELANRPIIVNKELTKINEISVLRPISAVEPHQSRGEFTVVVIPAEVTQGDRPGQLLKAVSVVRALQETCGLDLAESLKAAAAGLGLKEASVRNAVKKSAILAKRQNVHGRPAAADPGHGPSDR